MSRKPDWQVALGVGLLTLSALLYVVHWLIFRDAHHIWIYMVGDIAFLPIEVLLVTMIIHSVLSDREKKALRSKLNMVIGAFFSEVGTKLLRSCVAVDPGASSLRDGLEVSAAWSPKEFAAARRALTGCGDGMAPSAEDLEELRRFLVERRGFMLRLLENPNLLEHETFSDLLWAVFHLTDELSLRGEIATLPAGDLQHLSGDLRRAYGILAAQWLDYLGHLKQDYPYLFSLAARNNPFKAVTVIEVA